MRGLMTAVSGIDGGSGRAAARSFAIVQRRKSRREEWETHVRLASLMQRYIDPSCVFWSSLENAPRSMLGGLFARRRNVRAGLPDLMVIARGLPPVFVELKSSRGVASAAKIRTELVAAGCSWFLVRSSGAGLAALFYAGIPFKRRWQPPKRLRPWEGPLLGTEKRGTLSGPRALTQPPSLSCGSSLAGHPRMLRQPRSRRNIRHADTGACRALPAPQAVHSEFLL
jgi:hypothetical protein